jgi:hypothetical protein
MATETSNDIAQLNHQGFLEMNQQIRDSGLQMTGALRYEQVQPQQYDQGDAVPPGYLVENARLIAHAVENRESTGNQAPYAIGESTTGTEVQDVAARLPQDVQNEVRLEAAAAIHQQVQQQEVPQQYPQQHQQMHPHYYHQYGMMHYPQHYIPQHHPWYARPALPLIQAAAQPTQPPVQKVTYSLKKPPESWKADWRVLCRICGWEKERHGRNKNFGPGNCKIDVCNYCEKTKILHINESRKRNLDKKHDDYLMGQYCIFTTTYYEKLYGKDNI